VITFKSSADINKLVDPLITACTSEDHPCNSGGDVCRPTKCPREGIMLKDDNFILRSRKTGLPNSSGACRNRYKT